MVKRSNEDGLSKIYLKSFEANESFLMSLINVYVFVLTEEGTM